MKSLRLYVERFYMSKWQIYDQRITKEAFTEFWVNHPDYFGGKLNFDINTRLTSSRDVNMPLPEKVYRQ